MIIYQKWLIGYVNEVITIWIDIDVKCNLTAGYFFTKPAAALNVQNKLWNSSFKPTWTKKGC